MTFSQEVAKNPTTTQLFHFLSSARRRNSNY